DRGTDALLDDVVPDRRGSPDAAHKGAVAPWRCAERVPTEAVAGQGPLEPARRVAVVGEAQIDGIPAERVCELVHGALERERPLRVAGRAKGRGRAGVREDVVLLAPAVRTVVDHVEGAGDAR